MQYRTLNENPLPDNKHPQILKDEIIELKNKTSKDKYPKRFRRVSIWDDENKQGLNQIQ